VTRFDGLFQQAKRGVREASPKENRAPEPDAETVEHSDVQMSERLDVSTSKHLDAWLSARLDSQTSKRGKSKDPEFKRTTVYLRKQTHLKLRAAAIAEGQDMSEILQELAEAWLASKHPDV